MTQRCPRADRTTAASAANQAASVAGVSDSLNVAKQRLAERGERLRVLGEKTDAMSKGAGDFGDAARKLRESQSKGLFGRFL